MLRVFDIKAPFDHRRDVLPKLLADAMEIPAGDIYSWEIRRVAIDARKKSEIQLVYTIDTSIRSEGAALKTGGVHRIIPSPDEAYYPVHPGLESLAHRPVIVGSGPAGLFAGIILAQAGYRPLILERGKALDERCIDVARFWNQGILDPHSNAQFGEGGAGTFSDGKLNTTINDPRCRKVLEELVIAGAPEEILVSNKPHIGTDRLRLVVRSIRAGIISRGGEFRFSNRVTGLDTDNAGLKGLEINATESIECQAAIFAIGHSAFDTFGMLLNRGLSMIPKPFSIGMRIEHPQKHIDEAQFGRQAGHPILGAADYKMAYHAGNGRSAYTFCMCPGGEVIAAASEPGGVVTNGMSFLAREGRNANAALLVNVTPADFPGAHPLSGFTFQKKWERLAFKIAGETYSAPVQALADFCAGRVSASLGFVQPTYTPAITLADLNACLPSYVCDTIKKAIPAFGRQLRGFDLADAVLTGVETRSSSPVRMVRGDNMQSSISGVYPAGEGAGYAGGILSAAVDGIRVAEAVIARFTHPVK